MKFEKALVLIFGAFLLSACEETFKANLRVPNILIDDTATYELKVKDKSLIIRAKFPPAAKAGDIIELRGKIAQKAPNEERTISFKLSENSKWRITELKAVQDKERLRVFLRLDIRREINLPVYESPVEKQYSFTPKKSPVGVVMIGEVHSEDSWSRQCTAFMVSHDLVVTNWHCLPSEDYCPTTRFKIWNDEEGILRKAFVGGTNFECAEFIYSSEISDQALFRVETPAVGYDYFRVERASYFYPPKTPITLISENPPGTKRWRECLVDQQYSSVACSLGSKGEYSKPREDSYETSKNCKAFDGDSGSPVVNYDGFVIGVTWGGGDKEDVSAVFTPLDPEIVRLIP